MGDNLRSRQLNPCDHLFWRSRGYPGRPDDWRERLEDMGYYDETDSSNDEEETESEYESEESEYDSEEEETDSEYEEHRLNSNQNNPNNDEFWRLRGWNGRPDDWRERVN